MNVTEKVKHSIRRDSESVGSHTSDGSRFRKSVSTSEQSFTLGGRLESSSEDEHLSLSDGELVA